MTGCVMHGLNSRIFDDLRFRLGSWVVILVSDVKLFKSRRGLYAYGLRC